MRALVVGCEKYRDLEELDNPGCDAAAFAELLRAAGGEARFSFSSLYCHCPPLSYALFSVLLLRRSRLDGPAASLVTGSRRQTLLRLRRGRGLEATAPLLLLLPSTKPLNPKP